MLDSIWLVGILIVGGIVGLAVGGLFIFQRLAEGRWRLSEDSNNDIIFFASAIGVFYSLIVGLIAVGVWTNYSEVQTIVSNEAAALGALYRDVTGLREPTAALLQNELKEYTETVINQDWPAQQQGVILNIGTQELNKFESILYAYEPATMGQQSVYAETLQEFNNLVRYRRRRIEALEGGLPTVMWTIVLVGAILAITVTYLLKIERPTHFLLTAFLAMFIGLVVFVIYGLNAPLTGPLSIEPTAYQLILDRLINLTH